MRKTAALPAKLDAKPGENRLQYRLQNQVKTREKPGECKTPRTPQGFRLRYGLRLRLNSSATYWPRTAKGSAPCDTLRPVNVSGAAASSGCVPPIGRQIGRAASSSSSPQNPRIANRCTFTATMDAWHAPPACQRLGSPGATPHGSLLSVAGPWGPIPNRYAWSGLPAARTHPNSRKEPLP